MVILHIANIDPAMIGGVQMAVPGMVLAQSRYADVALVNTHGDTIEGINTICCNGEFDVESFDAPFNKPDIVVFHEIYRFEFIGIYRFLKKQGIPYVIIPHGCFSKKAQQKKWLKKAVANLVFFNDFIKHAQSIQYLSDNEQRMSAFQKMPSFVLGNGVVVPKEKAAPVSMETVRFVYIGRLEIHIKGLDLLLNAVKACERLLRERGATVEIYGPDDNGAHETISRMIAQSNLADLVTLGKEKMGEAKKEILLSSTCFIQTSRTEGLPLGPLEALGYGLPCIVTKGVGLGNIIESYGAGFQCENTADGIAKSMALFVENTGDIESMSQSAIRLVEENFEIDTIAQKTVDRYSNMLN